MSKENKNTFLNRLGSFVGFGKKEEKILKKSFNIAKNNRLNNSFNVSKSDINSDVYTDGYRLMVIARNYEKNNPFVRKFLNVMVSNVIGATGFTLFVRGADYKPETVDNKTIYKAYIDEYANKVVQDSFWDWTKKGNCDQSGVLSLQEIEELMVRQLIRDGEFLIVKHKGGKELNKWGFKLQLINNERFDRYLSGTNPKNGNKIVMNVELDENNKRIAYYFSKVIVSVVPGMQQPSSKKQTDFGNYIRVEANDCLHIFKATDAEQLRGYSHLVAGLETLEHLEGYQEAELVNARASAGKMGFFISNGQNVEQLDIADYETEQGEFISEVEPGTFHVLPNGYDYKENNPNYPQTYDKFVKVNLRTVASAFNISYEELANDRENVNFSSIRAGMISDREIFKSLQTFLIENVLDNIYEEWLKNSLLNKAIIFPNGAVLSFDKFDKFKVHQWRGRGFPYVNPEQDINASIKAVAFGLSSRQREAEKLGIDIQEIFDELAWEKQLAESKGINLSNAENVLSAGNTENPADKENQNNDNTNNINNVKK